MRPIRSHPVGVLVYIYILYAVRNARVVLVPRARRTQHEDRDRGPAPSPARQTSPASRPAARPPLNVHSTDRQSNAAVSLPRALFVTKSVTIFAERRRPRAVRGARGSVTFGSRRQRAAG